MTDKVIETLTKVLANSYVLLLKKQNYHWNVKGSNFYSLHKMFEEQYDEQFEAIDTIAERIRAVGSITVGSFAEYLDISDIKEEKSGTANAQEMLKNLAASEEVILTSIEAARQAAEDAGDEASVDLMIVRLDQHSKNKWMLEASIG